MKKLTKLEMVLEALFKALNEEFKKDPMQPGIVASLLPDGRTYCSIVRYREAYGGGKEILAQGYGATYLEAVTDASKKWLVSHAQRAALSKLVA